ncbi:hypothetical protein Goarm_006267, partial [Gossypium armourianum]|nr:hypothetical protein [Gossypium armourianum]
MIVDHRNRRGYQKQPTDKKGNDWEKLVGSRFNVLHDLREENKYGNRMVDSTNFKGKNVAIYDNSLGINDSAIARHSGMRLKLHEPGSQDNLAANELGRVEPVYGFGYSLSIPILENESSGREGSSLASVVEVVDLSIVSTKLFKGIDYLKLRDSKRVRKFSISTFTKNKCSKFKWKASVRMVISDAM